MGEDGRSRDDIGKWFEEDKRLFNDRNCKFLLSGFGPRGIGANSEKQMNFRF